MLLRGLPLRLAEMAALAKGGEAVEFDADAWERMLAARRVVERAVESGETVYGVNTGFGKLSDVRIGHDALAELQTNLVRSHACGVGEPLRPDETRLVLCLRANCFATGRSGIRPETAEALLRLYRADALPVVPSVGSVGASGDLAPLAHVALVLIGEGEAWVRGARTSGRDALAAAGIEPVALAPKEGLSLVNGTQVMLAVGALALHRAISVARAADVAAAMSTEALLGTDAAFDPRIHAARPHGGQAKVAAKLARLMSASGLRETHRTDDPRVQDAYSIRCAPQVHGACRDSLEHAARVVEVESGAATDNPLVFAEEGELISGGNFHGAPIALAFDQARTALAVLASICERRTDRLVNPDLNEGLPPFLSGRPGLESGLMMPHVLSAALVNELRTTSHPACVDNTPTSGGKEDHVSMGMTGALLLRRAVEAAALVVAVELAAAARGLAFREPTLPGPELQAASAAVRTHAPVQSGDAPLGPVVEALARAVLSGEFDAFGESP